MRKFLVALLILSVMGGVFAQEDAEKGSGKWGAFSGSLELGTVIDLGHGYDYIEDESDAFNGELATIKRDGFDAVAKLTWDYTKGDWSITLPFTVNKRGVSTLSWDGGWDGKNAKVVYNPDSPLTVTIPFAFVIDDTFNLLTNGPFQTSWYNGNQKDKNGIGLEVKYVTDTYGFGGKYNSIMHTSAETGPADVWGWLKLFDDKLLVAAETDGYNTAWWRASTIALSGRIAFSYSDSRSTNVGIGAHEHDMRIGYEHYARNFENIDEGGGIALKYSLNDSINFGLAFRGGAAPSFVLGSGTPNTVNPYGYTGNTGNTGMAAIFNTTAGNFYHNFLAQPIIGFGFASDMIKASAVMQLSYYVKPGENPGDDPEHAFKLHAAGGVSFIGVENLVVNADFSAYEIGLEDELYFNIGASVSYKLPDLGLTIDAKFGGTDLAYTEDKAEDWKAIGFEAIVGYTNALTDTLTFGAKAGIAYVTRDWWTNEDLNPMADEFGAYVRSQIEPTLTWKPNANTTFTLGYVLGLSFDDKDPALMDTLVYKNEVKASFKWTF